MQRVGASVLRALERGRLERRGASPLRGRVPPRGGGAGGGLAGGGREGWTEACERAGRSRRGGDGARRAVGRLRPCSWSIRAGGRQRRWARDAGMRPGVDGGGGSAGALGGAVRDRGEPAGDLDDEARGPEEALWLQRGRPGAGGL